MNKIIEVHRKEIILGFQQRHPDCKAISADKCDSCPEHKHLFMVGYYDFIASYQRYIHEWAIPITLLPIDHIVAGGIRLRRTYANGP